MTHEGLKDIDTAVDASPPGLTDFAEFTPQADNEPHTIIDPDVARRFREELGSASPAPDTTAAVYAPIFSEHTPLDRPEQSSLPGNQPPEPEAGGHGILEVEDTFVRPSAHVATDEFADSRNFFIDPVTASALQAVRPKRFVSNTPQTPEEPPLAEVNHRGERSEMPGLSDKPLPPSVDEADFDALIHGVASPYPSQAKGDDNLRPSPMKQLERGFGDADEIRRVARLAEGTAKIIPILLGVLLSFATLLGLLLLLGGPAEDQHVRLRFLDGVGESGPKPLEPGEAPTKIQIDTVPPGVLVVFDKSIIGRTPCTGEVQVHLPDEVGAELSGPYFETWVGELRRDVAGKYQIRIKLKPK